MLIVFAIVSLTIVIRIWQVSINPLHFVLVYQPSPFRSLHIHKQNLSFSMTLVPAAEGTPERIALIMRIPTRWVPI